MKTSVILTFATMVTAAVALPAATTNTESTYAVHGEDEIGTPTLYRRSSNQDMLNNAAHYLANCMASMLTIIPDYYARLAFCLGN
ncbi:hypothetical protein PspLS_04101 [Pyricularia sp. CBS 133598]|nr:hypothetical protein PspLS_04101 [Pyricularia sp. CBS 133598]